MIEAIEVKSVCGDRHCFGVDSNGILRFTGSLRFGEIYDDSTRHFKYCPECGERLQKTLENYIKNFPSGGNNG